MLFANRPCDFLIVGLGNPGREYDATRHNVGFCVLDRLAAGANVKIDRAKFSALTCLARIGGKKVLLMKPQTFMNLSGQAVRQAADFYKLPAECVIVVHDDIDLPVGRIRVRPTGSAGGHNGLKSIIACLGTQDFLRVKVGVGAKPNPEYDLADWVLSRFSAQEKKLLESAEARAADAALALLTAGVDDVECRFNGAV